MRILITTEFYLPLQCGITTAILNEKKVLEEKGHEVRILTIYDKKKSTYKDGVYYFRSNFPQLYQDSYATIVINDPLFEDIYEWHPDIVHSQCEFFTMFIAKKIVRKLNIPLVHTCHTDFDAYGIHFTKSDRLWDWATSTFIPRFLKGVDYIICPTNKNYDLLKRYGTKNPMIIIPKGNDSDSSLLRDFDGSLHRLCSIQRPKAPVTVPALKRTESEYNLALRFHIDSPVIDIFNDAGETIDSVT